MHDFFYYFTIEGDFGRGTFRAHNSVEVIGFTVVTL